MAAIGRTDIQTHRNLGWAHCQNGLVNIEGSTTVPRRVPRGSTGLGIAMSLDSRCVAESVGPFDSLMSAGAGPEFYLKEEFIGAANRGCAVVLPVLSGRSIGCEEYPGGCRTARAGSGDTRRDRIELLTSIWLQESQEAARLIEKWRGNYLNAMSRLIRSIHVPVFLVWMSSRRPSDWSAELSRNDPDFGSFPQLVSKDMVDELASLATSYTELSPDPCPTFPLTSRLPGRPCLFSSRMAGRCGHIPTIRPPRPIESCSTG